MSVVCEERRCGHRVPLSFSRPLSPTHTKKTGAASIKKIYTLPRYDMSRSGIISRLMAIPSRPSVAQPYSVNRIADLKSGRSMVVHLRRKRNSAVIAVGNLIYFYKFFLRGSFLTYTPLSW